MKKVGQKTKFQLRLTACLLAVCVCMPLLSFAEQKTHEGSGWDTPEDAVLYYLEGLKEQNLEKMISAYAVETYIDHFDLTAHLSRIRSYATSMVPRLPNSEGLLKSINSEARKNEIVQFILWQMTAICMPEQYFDQPILFSEENASTAARTFVEGLENAYAAVDFSTLKALRFIPPEQISELYASERNQENMRAQIAPFGAEEVRSLIVLFTVDDRIGMLTCDAMRYEKSWYLYRPGGNIAMLIGISPLTGGIVAIPQTEIATLLDSLGAADLETWGAFLGDLFPLR